LFSYCQSIIHLDAEISDGARALNRRHILLGSTTLLCAISRPPIDALPDRRRQLPLPRPTGLICGIIE
jgi:hypothetical protein